MEGLKLFEEIHQIAQNELPSKFFELEKLPNRDGSSSYEVFIYSNKDRVAENGFLIGYSYYPDPGTIGFYLPGTTLEYPLSLYRTEAHKEVLEPIKAIIQALGQKKLLRTNYYLGNTKMADEYWIKGSSKPLFDPSFRWYKFFPKRTEIIN